MHYIIYLQVLQDNYSYKELAKEGDAVQEVTVGKGTEKSVKVIYQKNAGKLIKKGQGNNISQNVQINENISAPLNKGDIVGKVQFLDGENIIEEVNLVSDKTIDKIGMWNMVSDLYKKWFNLLR